MTGVLVFLTTMVFQSCERANRSTMNSSEFSGKTTIHVTPEDQADDFNPTFSSPGLSYGEDYPKITQTGEGLARMGFEYSAIEPISIRISESGYETETVVLTSDSPREIKIELKRKTSGNGVSEQNGDGKPDPASS